MPKFSKLSLARLETCHPVLQFLFHRVIEVYDCIILEGYRSEAVQEGLYRQGKTKVHWPHSKHNQKPSLAVDAAPYPVDWNLENRDNLKRWYYFGGLVLGIAHAYGIPLRWGGDWDRDGDFRDQNFNDLPHFELIT